jgi:hypothetical protein
VTLTWSLPEGAPALLQACVSASVAAADSNGFSYIALGFSASPGQSMNNSDIVLAYALPDGTPVFDSLYGASPVGFPRGKPALILSETTLLSTANELKLCFVRPLAGGHVPLDPAQPGHVIWALGPASAKGPQYHGVVRLCLFGGAFHQSYYTYWSHTGCAGPHGQDAAAPERQHTRDQLGRGHVPVVYLIYYIL